MTEPGTSDQDELASAISDEVHRIHRDSYGYGATDVETYLLDEHILTVLDGIELSPGEKVLISAGRQELVREVRRQFQLSIKPTFTAAIERVTGRRVLAFISFTHLDPDFMVELFKLAPDGSDPAELEDAMGG